MKRSFGLIIVIVLLISGCGSSKRLLEKGNYDLAINKAVNELRRKPGDQKQADILERAMNIALEQDNERLRYLKIEGRASAWDEIYLIYQKMSERQSAVRTVTPLQLRERTLEWP